MAYLTGLHFDPFTTRSEEIKPVVPAISTDASGQTGDQVFGDLTKRRGQRLAAEERAANDERKRLSDLDLL